MKQVDLHQAKINQFNNEQFWCMFKWHNSPSVARPLLNKSNPALDVPDVFTSSRCINLNFGHIFHELIKFLIHQNIHNIKTKYRISLTTLVKCLLSCRVVRIKRDSSVLYLQTSHLQLKLRIFCTP